MNVSIPLQIKPYNIYVTVAYPPDTDTPGLAEENKTKVHTLSTRETPKSILPPFLTGSPSFSSFLASRDQINLGDLRGLPAGPSGQSDSSGCSGETRVWVSWSVSCEREW